MGLVACGRDHFDPAHNVAFVTSTVHDPLTFGADFAGADATCAAAAADAGLHGTYVAYLASSAVRAPDRLGNARGWIRVDGEPFVDRVADLTAGRIFNPLRIDEHGEDVGVAAGPVATGAYPNGDPSSTCDNWSNPAGSYLFGAAHGTTEAWSWTDGFPVSCASAARLYCFGTTFDSPLEPAPAPGPRAFITIQAFVPGGGLAAADALCANEASLAGLPGTFRALLGTSTAPAASRFDLAGPTWMRVDGVPLASSRLAFVAGELATSPSVTALGTDVVRRVLTGGAPGQIDGSCSDWTDPSATGTAGTSNRASTSAFGAIFSDCVGYPIYCLEP